MAGELRSAAAPLWAITAYFNPFDEPHRLENFRRFRAGLGAPLVAVELSFDGRFHLGPGDADIVVHRGGGDVMWQKERLLNLALAALPEACTRIAWIDCDILFAERDWPSRASDLLDRFAVIQLFKAVHYLERDDFEPVERADRYKRPSLMATLARGGETEIVVDTALEGLVAPYAGGVALAARRDLLAGHGFYDRCVIGGGDRVLIGAILGAFEHSRRYAYWNARQIAHYSSWARPFHRAVAGSIGYLPVDIFHLWHGTLESRLYRKRHQAFSAFDFDPAVDVAVGDQGALQWATEKPGMHSYVRDYFRMRRDVAV